MEKFQELREEAKRKIAVADHLLTQTYPLMQDSKLLLIVLENVFLALTNSMGSLLSYERLFKRIPIYTDNFESKFKILQTKLATRYRIERKYIDAIKEVKDIIAHHKDSPVEFKRRDIFVICDNNYKMKTISVSNIKEYLQMTKEFMSLVEVFTSKNEEIFN